MNGALLLWYSLFLWPSDHRYLRLEFGWCWLKEESCCDMIPPAILTQDLSQTFTPVIRVLLLIHLPARLLLWGAPEQPSTALAFPRCICVFIFSLFLEGKLSSFAGSCSPQCSYGSVTVEESTPPDLQPVVACVNVNLLCRWTVSALVIILPNAQSLFGMQIQPPASYFMLLHTAVSLTAACLAVCTVLKTFGTPLRPLSLIAFRCSRSSF